jgi:hypothetical protein
MTNYDIKRDKLAILYEKGDLDSGERIAREILTVNPKEPFANHFLGLVAFKKNDLNTAIGYMLHSINYLPENDEFYSNLGEVYRKANQPQLAIKFLKKALLINPESVNALFNLSLVFQSINEKQLAIDTCHQCLKHQPEHIEALTHLNVMFQSTGRYDDAIRVCETLLNLNIEDSNAWNSLGVACHKKGKYEIAAQCFDKTLQINPKHALAHENRAVLWLLKEEYEKGFLEYQWFRKKMIYPELLVNDTLNGKRILIYSERGFGDIIQFSRYLFLLKEQHASIIFRVPNVLMRLFLASQIADQYILNDQKDLPTYDCAAGILFLPCFFKTSAKTIPSKIPYLKAPVEVRRILREEIKKHKKQFNVGIVWAGNPQNENDLHRSIPLSYFESIARLPGIRLFSFQKDRHHIQQINQLPNDISIINLGVLFEDFADTATAIQSMDLMICVETAVAHLAGAMGHPTWLLISTVPDWRWRLDCQENSWYPSMKIFRQSKADNWHELMIMVKDALLPLMVKMMYQRGILQMENKQYSQAYHFFETITQINPKYFNAWFNMGNACGFQKHYNQSIDCYEHAVAINPDHAICQYNFGRAWYSQRKYQNAITCFEKAIELEPSYFKAIYNLGSAHYRIRNLDQSIQYFKQAQELKPDKIDIFTNIGACYGKKGALTTSIKWHQKSLETSPDYADGHYNLGISLLLDGRLKEGFQEYEWRLRRSDFPKPAYDKPMWNGSEFQNRVVLVYMEQGFGDAIQFVRYLPQVKSRGGTVILVCHPFLQRLFATASGVDQIIPENSPLPAFDYHISLMSLPAIFETALETIPDKTPYLSIPLEPPDSMDNIIDAHQQFFKVGFVWAGNPANKHDRDRSIPLHFFSYLTSIKGLKMFSLQKEQQVDSFHLFDFIDLSPYIQDFSDTAYAISRLDLIISVDTAVAHLAGAIHHPVWVLLSKVPDWRWMLNREDSPWYASVRLFRQRAFDNWSDVFIDVINGLYDRLNYSEKYEIPEIGASSYMADQLFKQGNHFFQKNQFEIAIQKFQESLSIQPENIDVLFNLGLSYLQSDQTDEAIGCFKQIVTMDPNHEQSYNNLGIAYKKLGKTELSISSLESALKCQPESAQTLYNLGNAYKMSQLFDKAESFYQRAISIQPDFAECMNNLADLYIQEERYSDALKLMNQAIEKCAEYPEFYFNKGVILSRLGEYESAIENHRKAIAMRDDFIDAYYSLCFCLLIRGQLKEGFRLHEWRIPKYPEQHNYGLKRWKGESFENKRLLVYCEQGFGDCIQFARFLPQIKKKGGTVVLGCEPELYHLFHYVKGVDQVLKEGDNCPPFDLQVSIVSLPFLCKTSLDNIPSETPYFFIPKINHEMIDPVIQSKKDAYCIGLVWAGNPTHKGDSERSISYEIFTPFNALDNVQIFSFQKKSGMSQACEKMNWIDLSPYFNNFLDTAHAARQMNLIITVDTSMAHLAGALAIPVWVMIPAIPDWRWLLDRQDSPWYPTMRLFRKAENEDWENVVDEIIDMLKQNLQNI